MDQLNFPNSLCNDYLNPSFCLEMIERDQDVRFTIHAKQVWAAIGTGAEMSGSDLYIVWSPGEFLGEDCIVSTRKSDGHIIPTVSSTQIASIVPLQKNIIIPDWANLSCSFTVPKAQSNVGSSQFIWAIGSEVENLSDFKSDFNQHTNFGVMEIPLLNSSKETYGKILLIHGILFLVAWMITPIGIYFARYLQERWKNWKLVHIIIFALTSILSFISFFLVFMYKKGGHFKSSHAIIGVGVWAAMMLEILLVAFGIRNIHKWIGWILCALGISNVGLGITQYTKLYGKSVMANISGIIYWIFVGLGCICLVYGQYHVKISKIQIEDQNIKEGFKGSKEKQYAERLA